MRLRLGETTTQIHKPPAISAEKITIKSVISPNGEFYCKVVEYIGEVSKPIEASFEYFMVFNKVAFFRRRNGVEFFGK